MMPYLKDRDSSYFSIIIPTYNRPDRLSHCLSAIAQLDYPRDCFQVVVVDDGSPTPMDAIVAPFQQSLNLTLIRQENSGPATARNAGAAAATGHFLTFTDDDCTLSQNYFQILEKYVQQFPDHLIGGQTLNALSDNHCSTASQILIDYLYSYYNTHYRPNFFASNNFAMPKAQFEKMGGFDINFPLAAGEDREFCDRWLYHNYSMTYAPNMQIYHAHSLSLRSFWLQHFNYGRGAFCFHQIRAERADDRLQVEPITFYFNLLCYPFLKGPFLRACLLCALLFLSQVANVAGFFWEKARH
jgi:glycosyltransferase involved in cell wall biosynthesis